MPKARRRPPAPVAGPDWLCWEPFDFWRGRLPGERWELRLDDLASVETGPRRRRGFGRPAVAQVRFNLRSGGSVDVGLSGARELGPALDGLRGAG